MQQTKADALDEEKARRAIALEGSFQVACHMAEFLPNELAGIQPRGKDPFVKYAFAPYFHN